MPDDTVDRLKDLAELVKRMRQAQKGYFRTRDQRVLEESKKLESEVDDAVEQVLKPDTQGKLF